MPTAGEIEHVVTRRETSDNTRIAKRGPIVQIATTRPRFDQRAVGTRWWVWGLRVGNKVGERCDWASALVSSAGRWDWTMRRSDAHSSAAMPSRAATRQFTRARVYS